jgi:hypothetical protein
MRFFVNIVPDMGMTKLFRLGAEVCIWAQFDSSANTGHLALFQVSRLGDRFSQTNRNNAHATVT